MEILSFQRFKMLLEAEGDEAAADAPVDTPEPVEPPAPEEAPAAEPAAAPAPADTSVPADPFASAALPPDPNAPAPEQPSAVVKFVMLDSDREWHSEYDDGGGVKRFSEYELNLNDLTKWIDENGLTSEKDAILAAVQGKKGMPSSAYDKLKKALRSDSIGKDRGDIDIEYDEKQVPSTSDLNVAFVKKLD